MGTSIELKLGSVSLDYAKNHMGNDWGFLFQEGDLVRRTSDQIDYEYYRNNPGKDDVLAATELALARPLGLVVPRLRMLGDGLDGARAEYEALASEGVATMSQGGERLLTFEEFCDVANSIPIADLDDEYTEYETHDRDVIAQGRFAAMSEKFSRVPWTENSDMYWSEASYLAAKVCILSPPSMLHVFALGPANLDAELIWQFGDMVQAGWVDRSSFAGGAQRSQAVLVATEGASDARILRRALDVLRPNVSDFFRFIDGDERHHFWGTGNLVKFAEGLLRIDIQNKVLFLLDNDAEGVDAFRKLQQLTMPDNLRSMVLPTIDQLRSFPCLGPEGTHEADINGRAAAIECYLDLDLPNYPPARVIWSNYKKEIDAWQGAIEHKESYDRHFMSQSPEALLSGAYDTSKLCQVLDALISQASQLNR